MSECALPVAAIKIKKSLIIPIYNNEENIPFLIETLKSLALKQGTSFEVVFVIDGSPDQSFALLQSLLAELTFSTQLITHSRNFGSFAAIRTGMEYAKGTLIAVMAADLQEPPELINDLFVVLEKDAADVVFGQRLEREDPPLKKWLSSIYWFFYRKMVMPALPPGGVDIFACNERVKQAILSIKEHNSSLIAQLFWVGYRRAFLPYKRLKRTHGSSGWGFNRRLSYMLDSIFSYSDFPIKFILYVGIGSMVFTLITGSLTILAKLAGFITVPGYATMLLSLLLFGSLILASQGIIGCYLWRTLENSRQRPLTIVSHADDNNLA